MKLTKAAESLLGTVPDTKIAAATGMDKSSVCHARKRRGIGPAVPEKSGKYSWTLENEALLGTMPDTELAARLGLIAESVQNARTRRGIPAFVRGSDSPAPAEVKAARLAAGHTQRAAGALLGIPQATWCAIEKGACYMAPEAWARYQELCATAAPPQPPSTRSASR